MKKSLAIALKRHAFPITLPAGDVIHVRSLTHKESMESVELSELDRAFFVLGSGLTEEDGTPCIERGEMAAQEFSTHATEQLQDLPLNVVATIGAAIIAGKPAAA